MAAALLVLFTGLAAGCSKSSSNDHGAASATGPITDSGSSGLKSDAQPGAPNGDVAPGEHTADAAHGKEIFTQNCAACHGADGTQGGVGPSLRHEKTRKSTTAAVAWIENPKPPMPKLYPAPLSDKDVADVAAYVESL